MFRPGPKQDPSVARALGEVRRLLRDAQVGQGAHLHVAVSGGADSMVALSLLHSLSRSMRWTLSVGHVDHGLRLESRAESELVSAHARALGLAAFVDTLSILAGPGLATRAREARHAALRGQAQAAGAQYIVLGHTASDRAETMLMFLARGAGLAGLGAMHEVDGVLLRPLLTQTRSQVRALAVLLELPFVDDPSNEASDQARVLVRHEIIPRLEELNPRVQIHLCELATQAHEADLALEAWAAAEVERVPAESGAEISPPGPRLSESLLPLGSMRALANPIVERIVRRVLQRGGADLSELPRRTILALVHAIRHPGERRVFHVHPEREVQITRDLLRVVARLPCAHEVDQARTDG